MAVKELNVEMKFWLLHVSFCLKIPQQILPQLEQFEKVILWFGNDVRSRQAANQFSKKLNVQRCHFVRQVVKCQTHPPLPY